LRHILSFWLLVLIRAFSVPSAWLATISGVVSGMGLDRVVKGIPA
jgi:hypothetical protein